MHKLCPTLTDCICSYHLKKNLCLFLSVVQQNIFLFVHFKPFVFLFFFTLFSSQLFQVLLQSRFQTPELSIPVQQEAQKACCVGAGCGKENRSVKEVVGKQNEHFILCDCSSGPRN